MKKILLALAIISSFLFVGISLAGNDSDPVVMLKSLSDTVIAKLEANKADLKDNPQLVYNIINKIIVPKADLNKMSENVLPPATWRSATPHERAEFESEFTNLLVNTYSSALADYTNQTIKFMPLRGSIENKSTVTVYSQVIRSDGPAMSMNYSLARNGNAWKMVDITVEGVSLLQSFRQQFQEQLSAGKNMAQLIAFIKQHNSKKSSDS